MSISKKETTIKVIQEAIDELLKPVDGNTQFIGGDVKKTYENLQKTQQYLTDRA